MEVAIKGKAKIELKDTITFALGKDIVKMRQLVNIDAPLPRACDKKGALRESCGLWVGP
jgi:hypothetical protein